MSLVVALVFGLIIVIIQVVIPSLGWNGFPAWVRDLHIMVPMLLLLSSLIHVALMDDPDVRRRDRPSRWHVFAGGLMAGLSCAYLAHRGLGLPITAELLICGALGGVVLAFTGVMRWIAKGL